MKISVVIPAYRVTDHVLQVIELIGTEVTSIVVVDDACPDGSGKLVEDKCSDPRVRVIYHETNKGVGGATITGYRQALELGAQIVVKIDGDGQMDPRDLPALVHPIVHGRADYTKGNRFYRPEFLYQMPPVRLIGNTVCSFLNKASSGYWHLMDATSGYTAIHANCLSWINLDKIDERYFFESDMLFRLGVMRAVVRDIPQVATYGDEQSNLSPLKASFEFLGKYANRFLKRIAYSYFVRDFNTCSLQLITGILFLISGSLFGAYHWRLSILQGVPATTGTVMIATLLVILGFQLLMSVVYFDLTNIPRDPIHLLLIRRRERNRTE